MPTFSKEAVAYICELYGSVPASEIARDLGVTRQSVIQKVYALNQQRPADQKLRGCYRLSRKQRTQETRPDFGSRKQGLPYTALRWAAPTGEATTEVQHCQISPEQKKLLMTCYKQQTISQLAITLGASIVSIYKWLRVLNLQQFKKPPKPKPERKQRQVWSKEQIETLMAKKGSMPDSELAAMLDKTVAAVQTKFSSESKKRQQESSLETEQEAFNAAIREEAQRVNAILNNWKPLQRPENEFFVHHSRHGDRW